MSAVLRTLRDDDSRLRAMAIHDRSFLVEAGAGSGKTAVMAGRIAMMLAAGIAPRHIAAVTFTELAASELLLRAREFVAALTHGTMPPQLQVALPDQFPNRPGRVVGLHQLFNVHSTEHQLVAPDRFHPNTGLVLGGRHFRS